MRNILTKLGSFFEAHVEKIVLVVVLILCGWILMTRVIFTPYQVSLDNRTFSPSRIDDYIHDQYANSVIAALESRPVVNEEDTTTRLTGPIADDDPVRVGIKGDLTNGYIGVIKDSIPSVDPSWGIALPSDIEKEIDGPVVLAGEGRGYELPVIGDLWDIDVEHFRATAYVPTAVLTEEDAYSASNSEPNDIDFITVQATFNASALYSRFRDSFAGSQLPQEWRNEELATPIFGAMNLQRQEKRSDGTWSDWQDVPRLAIENRRQLFGIYEDVADLPPGGMHVRRLRMSDDFIRAELLQPSAYSMASAYEEWYPPKLHREYIKEYEKIRKQKAKEEREQRMEQRSANSRNGDRNNRRARGGTNTGGGDMMGYGDMGGGRSNTRRGSRTRGGSMGDDVYGYGDMGGTGNTRGTRRGARARAGGDNMDVMGYGDMTGYGEVGIGNVEYAEVMKEYNEIRITRNTDLAEESDLLVWAHDDTVEPGKRYRYRLRLGVLNPIAGTNNTTEAFANYRNKAILWSEFSDISKEIFIPKREYFFAKSYRDDQDEMTVEVCKYLYGYWRTHTFRVKPGAIIGGIVENKDKEDENNTMGAGYGMEGYGMEGYGMMGMTQEEEVTVNPDEYNLTMNSVFLGVSKAPGWTGTSTLRETVLYSMLYTEDGKQIAHAPVGSGSWDDQTRKIFNDIIKQKNRDIEDFKPFNAPSQMGTGSMGMEMMGYGY